MVIQQFLDDGLVEESDIGPVGMREENRHRWLMVEPTEEKKSLITQSKEREPQYEN